MFSLTEKQPHSHDHNTDHNHDHDHSHDQNQSKGAWNRILNIFHFHGHNHDHNELASDKAFLDNELGIRTVWWALIALTITSLLQIVIVYWSGSVALLADTVHNIGDGLNSIPLLIAFYLARRLATRRYTYGFGKAEDMAGIFIVLSIAFSAGYIFWESFQKLLSPEPLTNIGWVAAAAIIGFLGNEAVALLQIRVGRQIGSAALIADGLHARTDGLTSLAVLAAAGGSWLGFPIVDPIIGLLIGVAILFITRDATKTMWYRLMDAIDPGIIDDAESIVSAHPAVAAIETLKMRWIGHQLHAEIGIAIDGQLTTAESQQIIADIRHQLNHKITNLSENDAVIHTVPYKPAFAQTK